MKVECQYLELVDISTLMSHPKNAAKHSQKQITILAKLMRFQGWRHPVIVSTLSGYVVAGHARIEAAKLNGWNKVPVDYQDFKSIDQEYAFLISDNKIVELMDTDDELIKTEMINFPELDFELLGFETKTTSNKRSSEKQSRLLHECPKCGFEFSSTKKSGD